MSSRKGTRGILSAMMILGLVSLAGADEPAEYYVIDAKIMAIRADDLNGIKFEGEHVEGHWSQGSPQAESVIVGGLNDLQIGPWALTFDDAGRLLWDGNPEPPEAAGVELLTAPRLHVAPREKAVIMTRSQLQYFEPTGDGLFTLLTSEQEDAPGVEFGCTVTPEKNNRVILDIDLTLTLMERREEIPGVNLDVGRPILFTRAVASRLMIAQDRWALVSVQQVESASDEGGHFLLCLLRVRS